MDIAGLTAGNAPVKDMRGLSISPAAATELLGGAGWLVLRLDCSVIRDRGELFSACAAALGREYFAANWDGFTDALRSLPYDLKGRPGYALILERYETLFSSDPAALPAFLESVADARESLAGEHGAGLAVLAF
jgi:hypothetical protein